MNIFFINIPGLKRFGIFFLIFLCFIFISFALLDFIYPIDLNPKTKARVILSHENIPLRSFADENGVWRYNVTKDEISDLYIEALLGYEDRFFYYHPGVNIFSLARAGIQWITKGDIVSGGSTLTMQTARLKRPVKRSIKGKFVQIFSALQLEFHYSKDEILNYYLNHAPFGGTIEGVQAASFAYFDHSAKDLTRSQAALLAVMPQAPSRYRPDKHPENAKKARDKILNRLAEYNIWSKDSVNDAKKEIVAGWKIETKMTAPLLARRLDNDADKNRLRIKTFIKNSLQLSMEQLALDYCENLPPKVSLAILVMNNETGGVESYVGSSDFLNISRFGHVDMVTALRSPGSCMKPFIYGLAMDKGLIHSQSMLMDVPIQFDDYYPENFKRSFSGPVSVSKALSKSLNVPAVQVLDHIDPKYFYAKMVNAGFKIKFPKNSVPNLSMALGGFSTNLESLVMAYSSIGRKGKTIKPRFTPDDKIDENRLLSEGAAWIIYDILIPDNETNIFNIRNNFAVKTGTSYGYRDSWSIGVDKDYTIGVWVGRPDGTPIPGHYGAQTATPLLKMAFQLLPEHKRKITRPDSVRDSKICWPDSRPLFAFNGKCDEPRNAWILDETYPKTLTSTKKRIGPAVKEVAILVTKNDMFRVPGSCKAKDKLKKKKVTLWPGELESFLAKELRRSHKIPPIHPECRNIQNIVLEEPVKINGLKDGSKIVKKDKTTNYPAISLNVEGGTGPWYWFENSVMKVKGRSFIFKPEHPGKYQVLVVDQSGCMDQVNIEVF